MSERIERIGKEELTSIVTARNSALESSAAAEKAVNQAKILELEYRVLVQQIFLANNLKADCRVDQDTGIVTWPSETVQPDTIPPQEIHPSTTL